MQTLGHELAQKLVEQDGEAQDRQVRPIADFVDVVGVAVQEILPPQLAPRQVRLQLRSVVREAHAILVQFEHLAFPIHEQAEDLGNRIVFTRHRQLHCLYNPAVVAY